MRKKYYNEKDAPDKDNIILRTELEEIKRPKLFVARCVFDADTIPCETIEQFKDFVEEQLWQCDVEVWSYLTEEDNINNDMYEWLG